MSGISINWVLGLVYGAVFALGLVVAITHATHGEVGALGGFLLGLGGAGLGGLIGTGADRR